MMESWGPEVEVKSEQDYIDIRRLWCAVIGQACDDLCSYKVFVNEVDIHRQRAYRWSARGFLLSSTCKDLFLFLGLPYKKVTEHVFKESEMCKADPKYKPSIKGFWGKAA